VLTPRELQRLKSSAVSAVGLLTEPPSLTSAVPNWSSGDTIPLGARTLRIVEVRYDDADEASILVVEDMA
jgi:hypothetical protein